MITIKNPKSSGMDSIFPTLNRYVILDWSNVIRRAYHSTEQDKVLELLIFMLAKIKRENPDSKLVTALEGKGRDVRARMLPAYKANRKPDEEFNKMERKCRKLLDFIQGTVIKAPLGEADDAIACFVQKMKKGERALIISEDRDLWQLVEGDTVKAQVRKFGEVNESKCLEVLGVSPKNVACLKAFLGDSDNVPRGVPRMKTATLTRLAGAGRSPGAAYKNAKATKLLTDKELQHIVKYKEQVNLNYNLVRLRGNLKLLSKENAGNPTEFMRFLAAQQLYRVEVSTIKQLSGKGPR